MLTEPLPFPQANVGATLGAPRRAANCVVDFPWRSTFLGIPAAASPARFPNFCRWRQRSSTYARSVLDLSPLLLRRHCLEQLHSISRSFCADTIGHNVSRSRQRSPTGLPVLFLRRRYRSQRLFSHRLLRGSVAQVRDTRGEGAGSGHGSSGCACEAFP